MQLNTSEKYIPFIENAEEKLRGICERRAVELYGEMPEIIKERLEFEISALKKSKEIEILLIFYRVLQNEEIKPYMITENWYLASSVVSYLFGITKANPLPSHYRCKCGDYYDFDENNVSVGADLPDKLCPVCGKKLIKDGFNLHSELMLFGENGEGTSYVELKVPRGKERKIIDIIEKMPEIQPITDFPPSWITDEMRERHYRFDLRVIVPKYIDLDDLYNSPHNFDVNTFLYKSYPFYTFRLHTDESLDWLTAMGEMSGTDVDEIEFEGTNILHIFSETAENEYILEKKIRKILPECNPRTVSECIKTEALRHYGLWQDIGKKIVESGKAKLNDLPPTIEDVYETLVNMGLPKDLSIDISKTVQKGKGLTAEQEKLLIKHGAEDWFIDFCNNVQWSLYNRETIAENLIVKNRLEYFRYNHNDIFTEVVNFRNNFDGVNGSIPNGVKTLSSYFFDGCNELQTVNIPNSVEIIDDYAFANCGKLENLEIPHSVKKIGEFAFLSCNSLKKITIPGSVKEICYCAFEGCDGLESVAIEKGLKKIGVSAFDFCENLREVKIPDSVEEIGSQAFAYCDNLKKITIPKSVIKMGDSVFDLMDSEPKIVVCCEKGSCADRWAQKNNLAVEYTE